MWEGVDVHRRCQERCKCRFTYGYKSRTGTFVNGNCCGREGGGDGEVWACLANVSAWVLPGMSTCAGTQQKVTFLYLLCNLIRYVWMRETMGCGFVISVIECRALRESEKSVKELDV